MNDGEQRYDLISYSVLSSDLCPDSNRLLFLHQRHPIEMTFQTEKGC